MEHEGSSRGTEEKNRRKSVEESAEHRSRRTENEPPMKSRSKKSEELKQDLPEDSDDEDNRAQVAGAKVFPTLLWKRLNDPPPERPTIDMWEFKQEGECMTMTFICDGQKYPMYFTPRSVVDYHMRANYWIPRHNPIYKALRTRLNSLPKTMRCNRIVFYNTPECDAEDCLVEFMLIKKWSCKQFEYNVCTEFSQPQHLRKLIQMLKPTEIMVNLNFGPYTYPHSHDPSMMHNHIAANWDSTLTMERDFRQDCEQLLNADVTKREVQNLYSEAGRAKAFGIQMLRTFTSLKKIVSLMTDRKIATNVPLKKFIINGPASDKLCNKLANILKEEGAEESSKKRGQYAQGERIYVCVRNDLRRAYKYSLAMPASSFKMDVGNEQLLSFTKNVPVFHCLFRTNIDHNGVTKLIEEWLKGDRNFDDIQVHVDKVIDPSFIDYLSPDHTDGKRVKIRRTIGHRRHTLYIEKERLATRHLSLRVIENKALGS